MAKLPKLVLGVASDYMRAVFQHALKEIESDSLDPSFLDNYQKEFVLTVPAVWSDKAKDMTLRVGLHLPLLDLSVRIYADSLKAARNAGINPVSMITEPEAASLFTLLSVKNKGLKVSSSPAFTYGICIPLILNY
jgi:molecular chaperone DnaK (HSP70)